MDEVDMWLAAAGISLEESAHNMKPKASQPHRQGGKRQGVGHTGTGPARNSVDGAAATLEAQVVQGNEALLQAARRGKRKADEIETAAIVEASAQRGSEETDSRAAAFSGPTAPQGQAKGKAGKQGRAGSATPSNAHAKSDKHVAIVPPKEAPKHPVSEHKQFIAHVHQEERGEGEVMHQGQGQGKHKGKESGKHVAIAPPKGMPKHAAAEHKQFLAAVHQEEAGEGAILHAIGGGSKGLRPSKEAKEEGKGGRADSHISKKARLH